MSGAINKRFRLEIEGLRAVAVIAVLLFHSGFGVISGGFLGVDIFFVISGFLITRNIVAEVEADRFRLSRFYWRRILRLFPASATTIFVTLLAGFVLLPPDEVTQLTHSAIAAIFAVSNVYFWMRVGYFDTDAHLKPLLHTWSLGVEEQFYLAWSLSLAAGLPSIRRPGMLWLILAATIASLLGAAIVLKHDPSAAFYLAPFRIFEFAAGIALALRDPAPPSNKPLRAAIFVAGLVSVFSSFFVLDSSTPMPGPLSLLPCLGAAAVIYAGAEHPAGMILTNPIAKFIGRISYSLYLTHWPVAVFIGTDTLWRKLAVLTVSFIGAITQFYLVEDPVRRAGRGIGCMPQVRACAICVALALCVVSEAALAGATQGLRFRLPMALRDMPSDQQLWAERNPSVRVGKCFLMPDQKFSDFDQQACMFIDSKKPNILVIGDSFASDLYSAFTQAYPGVNFLQATSGNCFPILNTPSDRNCHDLLNFVFADFLRKHRLDGVVLEAGWGYDDFDKIDATLQFLKPLVGVAYLVGPPVEFQKNISDLLFESRSIDTKSATQYVFAHRHPGTGANDALIQRFTGRVPLINLHSIMCIYQCRLFDTDGRRIFLDFGHLTKAGATYLANILKSHHPHLFGRDVRGSDSAGGTAEPDANYR